MLGLEGRKKTLETRKVARNGVKSRKEQERVVDSDGVQEETKEVGREGIGARARRERAHI